MLSEVPLFAAEEEGEGEAEFEAVEAAIAGSTSERVMTPFSNSKEKNAGLVGREFLR